MSTAIMVTFGLVLLSIAGIYAWSAQRRGRPRVRERRDGEPLGHLRDRWKR